MDALTQAFFRILLLRAGPQSLPASATLMWLALLSHLGGGLLLGVFTQTFGFALLSALVSTLLMVAMVHGLLLLFNRRERYRQTLTALAGCEVLLGLMLLPLPLSAHYFGEALGEGAGGMLVILWLVVVGWSVAVTAHIFRHALSVSVWLGFLYSIIYFTIAVTVGDMMGTAGAAQ